MYKVRIPKADLIAKISFAIFIFFSFFPTGMPFMESMQEQGIDEIGTSNLTNQIIFSSIFILASIAAIPKFNNIVSFIINEKAISIFLLWALITILWSDFPFVSFKRWFQIFTSYFIVIVYLVHHPSTKNLLSIIKPIIYSYILVTFIAVLTIPGAIDPVFGAWRGLTAHKNNLGQVGVILSVLSLIVYQGQGDKIKRFFALIFVLLSVILTLGTFSSTSYIALFIFLSVSVIIYFIMRIFERTGAGNFLSITLILSSLTTFIIIFYLYPQITDSVQGIFGKSETFYDRGKLWETMLWRISEHPILGCGFQGFWVIDSQKIQLLYNTFLWLPVQAHNGYLDIINEVGIIGIILLLIVIFRYIIIAVTHKKLDLWTWFIILPLIINITESTFFRPSQITFIFFILTYLLLFAFPNIKDYSDSLEYNQEK